MGSMKMRDQVDRYVRARCRSLSESSKLEVQHHLDRLASEWDRTRRAPASLDEDWMVEYLHQFQQGGAGGRGKALAVSSYNKSMTHYRAFLRYLTDKRVIGPDVADTCAPLPPEEGERKQFLRLTMAQIVHMVETIEDPWERWLCAFASQTLGRESELRSRKVGHLHIDRSVIDWYRPKTGRKEAIPHDELFLTNELVMEWQRWAYVYQRHAGSLEPWFYLVPSRGRVGWGSSGYVYRPGERHSRLSRTVQKHAARVAGVPQETLRGQGVHIIRRSMARALYDRLVTEEVYEPLTKVQAALGHATSRTTMLYIGLDPDRRARNDVLGGSSLLWVKQDNVTQLRGVSDTA